MAKRKRGEEHPYYADWVRTATCIMQVKSGDADYDDWMNDPNCIFHPYHTYFANGEVDPTLKGDARLHAFVDELLTRWDYWIEGQET